MRAFTGLLFLAGVVSASDWWHSCSGSAIEDGTATLHANCNVGDGAGTLTPSSLDLNACFAYDGAAIVPDTDGGFGASCSGCFTYDLPDPDYGACCGLVNPWLECTCDGRDVKTNLAKTQLTNNFGVLTCTTEG
ncbi:CVNH domain-containing protein [Xylariaceae sp. FL0016]|nr:CVNH domain-containing protein [Xylariaceae sp. FL0016]